MFRTVQNVCLLLVLLSVTTFAQYKTSPLAPEIFYSRPEAVGVFFGLGPIWQNGEFNVNCDCYSFTDGKGTMYTGGLVYETGSNSVNFFGERITFGLLAGYEYKSLTASYILLEDTTVTAANGKNFDNIPLPSKYQSTVSLGSYLAAPYIKYLPFRKALYARLAVPMNFVASSHRDFKKTLTQPRQFLPNGETVEFRLAPDSILSKLGYKRLSDTEVLIEDGELPSVNSFQVGLQIAMGTEISLTQRTFLCPTVQLTLPLSSVAKTQQIFSIPSFLFTLELRYSL